MKEFVGDYLAASVNNEDEGGRMRWYPWHSAEYRFNHTMNVVDLATHIAEEEGANADVTRVADTEPEDENSDEAEEPATNGKLDEETAEDVVDDAS
jgi:hypothetical protein